MQIRNLDEQISMNHNSQINCETLKLSSKNLTFDHYAISAIVLNS